MTDDPALMSLTNPAQFMATLMWLCRVASIVFGILAAWYWYKASTKKVTTKDNVTPADNESRGNLDSEGNRHLYTSTAIAQSKLNATAAIYYRSHGWFSGDSDSR